MNYVRYEGGAEMAAFILKKIEAKVYKPVADLVVDVWRSSEPLPFLDREKGIYQRCEPGQRWARERFDSAWVKFSYHEKLPEGDLVARIDLNGELCIVDPRGVPVRGLTCIRSSYEPTAGAPAKTVFEIPKEWGTDAGLSFWAEAGYNDLFGTPVGEGRVEMAYIALRYQEWRQLYYDFEVAADYFAGIPDTAAEKQGYLELLKRWEARVAVADVASLSEELKEILSFREVSSAMTISAIGHAHLDLAWLWPIRETYRKGARTFASALYNLERYPEYLFGCSQPQLFQWMKDQQPDLYASVLQRVREGRIEPLGSFWVEPDCNLINGESLVRQILYGKQFFEEEFGISPSFCWQPDVFGYNGQLPQILARSGHRYFMTQKLSWNLVNRFPHHSFVWEGIDGSHVLVHMLAEETYNGYAGPRSVRKIRDEYAERAVSSHALMVYGIGDGGGGPDAEHLERLRRVDGIPGLPKVIHQKAAEFFKEWSQESSAFPVWKGELYLEKHQGTYTTQGRAKRFNRLSEGLLREAEWSCTLASLLGVAYPRFELKALWQEVLLYQFHDILPGSSIERVYDELYPAYEHLIARLKGFIADAYQIVADHIGGTLCFNSYAWSRDAWLRKGAQWYRVALPACGWGRLEVVGSDGYERVLASPTSLENDVLRISFAEDGTLTSLWAKESGRELILHGSTGHVFTLCPDLGDAWDFECNIEGKDPTLYLQHARSQAKLTFVQAKEDGPKGWVEQEYEIGSSRLTVKISLEAGASLLRFDCKVEWREPRAMLRMATPTAICAEQALFEIPFGSIERSTEEGDSKSWAQFEVPALQWAALADERGGVALINNGKHGHRIKGGVLDLTLIRSVPYPNGAVVSPITGRAEAVQADTCTDIEAHEFSYGLYLWSGKIDRGEITKAARFFNTAVYEATGRLPVVASTTSPFRSAASVCSFSHQAIELASLKPAENGCGVIIRLSNTEATPISAQIHFVVPLSEIHECNLLEQNECLLNSASGQGIKLEFGAFEVKTLRLITERLLTF